MAKHKIACALTVAATLGSVFLFPAKTFAAEHNLLESCEGVEETCAVVTSSDELAAAINGGVNTVVVGADFDMLTDYYTVADLNLYLNNYTITTDGWSIINDLGSMVINAGENGKVVEIGGVYAPFYIHGNAVMNAGTIEAAEQALYVSDEGASFTMYGGKISGATSGVTLDDGATFVLEDGEIEGGTWVVIAFNDTEFTMNGGKVTTTGPDSIGVSGNGTSNPESGNYGGNAVFSLNAGEITSNDLGVYAPQVGGETYLGPDLVINATKAGVEVRAGHLTVDGTTINVDGDTPYAFNPNGSGSTATGVAIAVAQHTTKQAISAEVIDGNFTAPVAFAEGNPQANEEEDVEKVSLSITGGTFNATNGDPIVASEDVEKFITGGNYSKAVDTKYIADDYTEYELPDNTWTVDEVPSYTLPDEIYVQVGESVAVEGSVAPEYFSAGVVDSKATLDLENGTVTGVEAGSTEIMISWYDIDETTASVPVVVYDVESTDSAELTDDGETIKDTTAELIADFLQNGNDGEVYSTEKGTFENLEALKSALADGELVTSDLEVHTIDMNDQDWVDEIRTKFAEELKDNEQIAMVYFINLPVYVGGEQFGELFKLDETVTLRLGIPAGLPEVPEGFTRQFAVLRYHRDNGGTVTRLDTTVDGEDAVVENDLFSDFVLAYEDVENNPEGDTPGEGDDGEDTPGEDTPGEDTPGEGDDGEDTPGEDTPGEEGDDVPGDDTPSEETPDEEGEAGAPETGASTAASEFSSSLAAITATIAAIVVMASSFKFLRKNRR